MIIQNNSSIKTLAALFFLSMSIATATVKAQTAEVKINNIPANKTMLRRFQSIKTQKQTAHYNTKSQKDQKNLSAIQHHFLKMQEVIGKNLVTIGRKRPKNSIKTIKSSLLIAVK